MLIIYSAHSFIGTSYAEILAEFEPQLFNEKPAFLQAMVNADLALIDDDAELCAKAQAQNLSAIILCASAVPCLVEGIEWIAKPMRFWALKRRIGLLLKQIETGRRISFQTPHFTYSGQGKTLNDIPLTQKEAELVEYLFENKDRIVTKEELLSQIFNYNQSAETHTLETHIYKLRQKIAFANAELILTKDGGYQINLE